MNPSLIASTDCTRYIINSVQLKDGLLSATDGRRLVCMAVEPSDNHEDARNEALIPTTAFKAATKGRKSRLFKNEIQILDDSFAVHEDEDQKTIFADKIKGNFPNIAAVVPDPSNHTLRIAINPEFLLSLAKAMGDPSVATLHLDPAKMESGFFVTAGKADAFGILMPLRTTDNLSANRAIPKIAARKTPEAAPA